MAKNKIDLKDQRVRELTERIAGILGESDKKALFGISAMITINGSQFALRQLVEVAKLKRDGITLKTDDSSRYRSFGGAWFKLCKDNMTGANRYRYMSLVSPKKRNGKDRRGDSNGR